MPKTINPIRKARVKRARLKGKSKRASLLEGGYSEATASHHANSMTVLNCVDAEIIKDIQNKVTIDSVLSNLSIIEELAKTKNDYATATRCEELKGKWLAMFTDKNKIVADISQSYKQELNEYFSNRLKDIELHKN